MATQSSVDKGAVEIPDPIDKLKHLTKAARDNPNQWVCEACISAHEIKPATFLAREVDGYIFKSCPLTIEQFNKVAYNTPGHRIDPRHRKFDHRHVQLALKWTRLRDADYKPMLDAIMNCLVWKSICPHVGRFGSGPSPINRGVLSHSFMTAANRHVFRSQPETKFACENCATDYSITWREDWIELIVWQDFGPETSPGDGLWRSQCVDLLTPVIHEPGTITRMYEELPAETLAAAPENVASSRALASSQAGESNPADASSQSTS
ncbi:hypothetical protein FHL15_000335 [Xylaria flabelliformis]|uniref:Uncharacterized protein n=1 Tax=Xylaria flabelliformis TaxID=2512241 RepID=A0A553IFL6_9PEZI|nr:hypothetical protein FHL15_000335 [Xylaria flabelliformis]